MKHRNSAPKRLFALALAALTAFSTVSCRVAYKGDFLLTEEATTAAPETERTPEPDTKPVTEPVTEEETTAEPVTEEETTAEPETEPETTPVEPQGLDYTLKNNGTYEVSGIGTCKDKNLVIPNEYNGKPVTGIGDYAFFSCSSLTSVTIGDGVTSIGYEAFSDCDSLTHISVAEKNQHYAALDGVLYSKDMTTLICCPGGKSAVTIPDSVTSIGGSAFSNCGSLTDITIPAGVTSIGDSAFYGCDSLISVTIPDSVTSIGHEAFSWCTSLISIAIPDGVTSIGGWAFSYCSSLTDIYYTGTEAEWNAITKGDDWDFNTPAYTLHFNHQP